MHTQKCLLWKVLFHAIALPNNAFQHVCNQKNSGFFAFFTIPTATKMKRKSVLVKRLQQFSKGLPWWEEWVTSNLWMDATPFLCHRLHCHTVPTGSRSQSTDLRHSCTDIWLRSISLPRTHVVYIEPSAWIEDSIENLVKRTGFYSAKSYRLAMIWSEQTRGQREWQRLHRQTEKVKYGNLGRWGSDKENFIEEGETWVQPYNHSHSAM